MIDWSPVFRRRLGGASAGRFERSDGRPSWTGRASGSDGGGNVGDSAPIYVVEADTTPAIGLGGSDGVASSVLAATTIDAGAMPERRVARDSFSIPRYNGTTGMAIGNWAGTASFATEATSVASVASVAAEAVSAAVLTTATLGTILNSSLSLAVVGAAYTSAFLLTETPISEAGAWHHLGASWALIRTTGGHAIGTQTGLGGTDDSYAYLNGFGADQTAQATLWFDPTFGGNDFGEFELLLRWSDSLTTARGYEINIATGGQYVQIVKWLGNFNSFVVIAEQRVFPVGMKPPASGDIFKATISGSTINVYMNENDGAGDRLLATVSDSTYTDGNPGMGLLTVGTPPTLYGFSNYEATSSAVCFCAGTLIATPCGEVAVQHLKTGDTICTAGGKVEPIVWIGVGHVSVVPGERDAATPVVVCKGALAANVPCRDLRITKGHSLLLDGVLIPVEFLVNHRSIVWDDRAREIDIYHIELAHHDVILADGAAAESYRDDGNRWLFRNANAGWHLPSQPGCAPVLTGGPVVDAVWRRLLDHSGPRPGFVLTDEPDLHLLLDGVRLDSVSSARSIHVFHLRGRPELACVSSRSGSPAELGLARDPRMLGIAVRRIVLRQGALIRAIEASDATLAEGFHDFEVFNRFRWTDGWAPLPAALFEGFTGPIELSLEVACMTRYPLIVDAEQAA